MRAVVLGVGFEPCEWPYAAFDTYHAWTHTSPLELGPACAPCRRKKGECRAAVDAKSWGGVPRRCAHLAAGFAHSYWKAFGRLPLSTRRACAASRGFDARVLDDELKRCVAE